MSKPDIAPLTCEECGTTYKARIWSSVNGTLNPELRSDLLHNRLNMTTCPGCGAEAMASSLLYHDQARKFMVWFREPDPDGVIRIEPQAQKMVAILPNYILRIVPTRNALVEKIHAFELNLDDRIVEMVKYGLSMRAGDNGVEADSDKFWFAGQADESDENVSIGDLIFLDTESDGETAAYLKKSVHYDPMEEQFGHLLRHTGGRNEGWHQVDQAFVEDALGIDAPGGGDGSDLPSERRGPAPSHSGNALVEVGEILTRYIRIHEEVFKFSLRRVLPIPGVFKAVDFGAHQRALVACCHRLSDIDSGIRSDQQVGAAPTGSDTIRQYCAALQDAIGRLGDICGRLDAKANGFESYSSSTYKRDVAEYEASVARYQRFGDAMNALRWR